MAYIVDATIRRAGETDVRHIGKFEDKDEAVAAACRVVDKILEEQMREGLTSRELFSRYEAAGIFAYVFLDHDEETFNMRSFNHYQYAMKRCTELCGNDI